MSCLPNHPYTLPRHVEQAMMTIVKTRTTTWYRDHFRSKNEIRRFHNQNLELVSRQHGSVGFFDLTLLNLREALLRVEQSWGKRRRVLRDALQSLLFNFREVHLTTTQMVVLLLVPYYGCFCGFPLRQDFVQVLATIKVPHKDGSNQWSVILWTWVSFCNTYVSREETCFMLRLVFARCLKVITRRLQQQPPFFEQKPCPTCPRGVTRALDVDVPAQVCVHGLDRPGTT